MPRPSWNDAMAHAFSEVDNSTWRGVSSLVPEGFGVVTGRPKVGKSWFVLDVALTVARGEPGPLPGQTRGERPVLMVALEDGERRLQGRASHLLNGARVPERLYYQTKMDYPSDVAPTIEDWLRSCEGEDTLVILDTVESAMTEDPIGVLQELGCCVTNYPGATFIVVTRDPFLAAHSDADWVMELRREWGHEVGTAVLTGRDIPDTESGLRFDDRKWSMRSLSEDE